MNITKYRAFISHCIRIDRDKRSPLATPPTHKTEKPKKERLVFILPYVQLAIFSWLEKLQKTWVIFMNILPTLLNKAKSLADLMLGCKTSQVPGAQNNSVVSLNLDAWTTVVTVKQNKKRRIGFVSQLQLIATQNNQHSTKLKNIKKQLR